MADRSSIVPLSSLPKNRTDGPRVAVLAVFSLCVLFGQAHGQIFTALPTVDASNGGSTHESMLAAGPDKILHFTPQFVDFYDKSPTPVLLAHHPINTFFAPILPNGGISGDPVAFYDAIHGRYLMFMMGDAAASPAEVRLWISKGGLDPTQPQNWWKYIIPAPGRDYVGLGVSDDKIALLWNPGNCHILDRAKAYDNLYLPGEPITVSVPGVASFSRACRNLTADPAIHVVRRSGNNIEHRRITGPPNAPVLSAPALIPIPADPGVSAIAEQPDTTGFGNQCEPRPLNFAFPPPEMYMRNGKIAMAWTNSRTYGDGSPPVKAIRCIRFQVGGGLVDDFQVGRPGMHYTYPSVVEDTRGTLFLGYDRYSPNEFPSCYMVARSGNHQSPEFHVKSGLFSYMGCATATSCAAEDVNGVPAGRWGDYTSMIVDEFACGANHSTARFAGGWTSGPLVTDNAMATMVADYGTCSISGSVESDDNGLRTPKAGAPVVLDAEGLPVDSTTTDAAGAFSFGLLPAGTYRLRVAWPDTIGLLALGGTGGVSQIPECATEIDIVIADGQSSVNNRFVLRLQPTPQITSLSRTAVIASDPDFDLIVTGVNFRPWSMVSVDGRVKAATLDEAAGRFTVHVKHYDIARTGSHTVTVFTPAAAGNGTSAPTTLLSLPRYFVSIGVPSIIAPCPKGDAGRLVVSAVVKNSTIPECPFNASTASASLSLTSPDVPTWRVWDAPQTAQPFVLSSDGVYDPGTGRKTFTFDVGQISKCARVVPTLGITAAPSFSFAQVDVRSLDLTTQAFGSVDRFDIDAFGALLGGTERCGDFVPSGSVNLSDFAYLTAHQGHTAHTRHVLFPNGGEVYTRSEGSVPPIAIRWDTGCGGAPCGDSARVSINLLDGAASTLVASNLTDNGAFDWTTYCGVQSSPSKKIEVVHTAGILRPGDVTIGSDQSDGPFTINGSCGGGGGGGCPFLDTWTAGGWKEENSILARSTTGEMRTDIYRLMHEPERAADGTLRLRIREDEQERTRLASATLRTVDRDPAQSTWVMDGRVVLGSRVPVAKVRSGSGEDLTALLTDPNGPGFEGAPGTMLWVELWKSPSDGGPSTVPGRGGLGLGGAKKEIDDPGGGKSRPVAGRYDAEVLERTGIVVETVGENGAWTEVGRWYPRARNAELAIGAGREVRLRFVGRHLIQNLQWIRIDGEAPAVQTVAASAMHSDVGDVGARLTGTGEPVTLSPGERVDLSFPVPPVPEGKVRDTYFAAHGVYTTLPAVEEAPTAHRPSKLELHAARPNPTTGSVRFAFGLPQPARVRLAVYDAMGRVVARLADGQRDAGTHEASWDLSDRAGRRVSSGIYFYRMEVGSWRQERKLVVR